MRIGDEAVEIRGDVDCDVGGSGDDFEVERSVEAVTALFYY